MRRGFIFTIDALLSLLLVSVVLVSLVSVEENVKDVYKTSLRAQNLQDANALLGVLKRVPLNQLVPEETIEGWVNGGVLHPKLVNPSMSPLDIALTYWALSRAPGYGNLGLDEDAKTILTEVISRLLPGYGYEVIINSTKIASEGTPDGIDEVSSATMLVSGFAKGKKPLGYMARAYLMYAGHRYSRLIGIQRLVARGYGNTLHVGIPVQLPNDAANIDARGGFYARNLGLNRIELKIDPSGYSASLGDGSRVDLSDYILPGTNVLNFTIESDWDANEVGFGSGSVLLVSYDTNSTDFYDPNEVDLYDVTSKYSFVQFVTVIPTGEVRGIEVYLTVSGVSSINLYYDKGNSTCLVGKKGPRGGIVYFNSTEIESGLRNNCGLSDYRELNSRAFTFVIAVDSTWPSDSTHPEYSSTKRERHLYGFGESWVRVDVKSDLENLNYAIPLSIPLEPGDFSYSGDPYGTVYPTMSVTYHLPPTAIPWYADYWVAIQYRSGTRGTMRFTESNPDGTTVIQQTSHLKYYLYRYGYSRYTDTIMVPGEDNTFTAESRASGGYYGFRRGESWGTIYYFLRAYAPYGDMFDELMRGYPDYRGYNITYYAQDPEGNLVERKILAGDPPYLSITVDELDPDRYAADDAIIRLFSQLCKENGGRPGSRSNPLLVLLPDDVQIDFSGISGIPTISKPVPVTVRIWRSGP